MINHRKDSVSSQILVVDDSPASLKLLIEIFTHRGYQVRPATDGTMALRSVAIEAPDLILLDIKMPDMDGYEVCRHLKSKEQSRHIPVIFISGLDEVTDKVNGFAAGGVDYITKPFDSAEVLARVETHLSLRRLHMDLERHNVLLEREIAERRRAEEALLNAHAELEAFSYSVSHDLRAPLRGINGWSLALLEDYADRLDEQGRKYLELVRSETHHMETLIDSLLMLSRVTRSDMQREHLDLSTLAHEIAARCKEEEPHRQVEIVIQPQVTAYGDPKLVDIMLTNLLGNAWKFTATHSSARIEFGTKEIDGKTVYFVRDDGVGFNMAYAGKLFGAFQRMHKTSEFPGIGIGLATVQRIVHRHAGRVWAEAEVEKGAVFYFTLPHNFFS